MSGVNKVILVGRLGQDPEVKNLQTGQQVARLSIATSESWKDKQGQKQERTEWHRVIVWGKMAEVVGKYLSKGRQVYLEGKLQTRSWEDKETKAKKYVTEINASTVQFLGDNKGSEQQQGSQPGAQGSGDGFAPEPEFNSDEEIPF
jgi:single-strand DNA-binding protein